MIPERHAPTTYALFRIVFGFLFFSFGTQKLFGWFGGPAVALLSLQGAAGLIETVCGLLVMIGFLTRVAAFLASGEMAVAYFYIHWYMMGAVPLVNMGERATMFCFAFLYIASVGAGKWAIDAARRPAART
jgi:putative oxidoreductase